jgi:hypothetical protein
MTKTFVGTTEGGLSTALGPDICYVKAPDPPAGPGGFPIPFPNIAMVRNAVDTVKDDKVLIRNKKPLVEGSNIPASTGDEPGSSPGPVPGKEGMKSRVNTGKCEFKQHSQKVKFGGKGVICLGASTTHNDGNIPGMFGVPSQMTVLAEK